MLEGQWKPKQDGIGLLNLRAKHVAIILGVILAGLVKRDHNAISSIKPLGYSGCIHAEQRGCSGGLEKEERSVTK